ncbi:MAG: hypothetical protein ACLRSW_05570 [Christensenellaceae bacterium]
MISGRSAGASSKQLRRRGRRDQPPGRGYLPPCVGMRAAECDRVSSLALNKPRHCRPEMYGKISRSRQAAWTAATARNFKADQAGSWILCRSLRTVSPGVDRAYEVFEEKRKRRHENCDSHGR